METDDDMIVLVVGDDDVNERITQNPTSVSSEAFLRVEDIMKTAAKHGQYIEMKVEPADHYETEYEDAVTIEDRIKKELTENCFDPEFQYEYITCTGDTDIPDDTSPPDNSNDYILEKEHLATSLRPNHKKSFVEELRLQYAELCDNEELLTDALEQIMRSVKPPPPPRDFYIMNGIMMECVECGILSESAPAATRHYQEKHGERYLICYACGVDFRSCLAAVVQDLPILGSDAHIVLKARAGVVGRKGRGRPYLTLNNFHYKTTNRSSSPPKFACTQCSAVFMTRYTLESHENLHRGIRPYRCKSCPSAYTSHSALTRHSKKHMEIQFICEHCSRPFKVKAALVAHMETHNPIRKHACAECSRRFAQKAALVLHVHRVHRNLPPPCACQICPKRYPRMSLLKIHMKKAHGMSIITRKMFFKALPTMTEMEIKNSKIILKNLNNFRDEDSRFTIAAQQNEEQDNMKQDPTDTQETSQEFEESENLADYLQFVRKGQDLGENVIYIQNGEVVEMNDVTHTVK